MLLLPIATEAPLAHPPLATVGMVVATVLVYGAVGGGPTELSAALWLDYGQGLHRFQWLSSNFVDRLRRRDRGPGARGTDAGGEREPGLPRHAL